VIPTLGEAPPLDPQSERVLTSLLAELPKRVAGGDVEGLRAAAATRADDLFSRKGLNRVPALRPYDHPDLGRTVWDLAHWRLNPETGYAETDRAHEIWDGLMTESTATLALYAPAASLDDAGIEAFGASAEAAIGTERVPLDCERPWSPLECDRDEAQRREDSPDPDVEERARDLVADRPWLMSWLLSVTVHGPQPLVTRTLQRLAQYLAVAPAVAGYQSHVGEHEAKFEAFDDPRPLAGVRQIRTAVDVGQMLCHRRVKLLLRLFTMDPHDRLAAAVRLLFLARMSNQPDLSVVLSLASLEALCGLTPEQQIQKRVLDCFAILHTPGERDKVRRDLKTYYDARNTLVHGPKNGKGNAVGAPDGTVGSHVDFVADCLGRYLDLIGHAPVLDCARVDKRKSLTEVLDLYLTNHGAEAQEVRRACDAPATFDPTEAPGC
jgi:hypothetical protein